MKITKRQLRRIIKEEKRKLQEQAPMGGGVSEAIDRELMDLEFKLEKEIDARMSLENRLWLKDPAIVDAVIDMIDQLAAKFTKRGESA